ncbi:MAG: dihydrofolate reductase [Bacteriovoracia bacterium]
MPMKVSLIAAMSRNRVIGAENKLPWHIPEDLKWFRDKTAGHPVVMGRKTFESIGSKPLPKRENLVVTRQADFPATPGVRIFNSLEAALDWLKANDVPGKDEVFIVGGGQIYEQSLPYADRIYLTVIHQDFEGDSHFPEFNETQFAVTARIDREQPIPFSFLTYDRV